ncbi:MAG: PQQ-binding-like beta-propeller repeat protein [Candidatus Hydrogenedentes bacterium]|nr:PQQ-binding-like beta-propeller repeat protein [Candidatus Hydrogenedentota bacterium]
MHIRPFALMIALGAFFVSQSAFTGDWPEFRGPTGQGHAPEANPPLEWGPDRNIAWRTPLPGSGWSSPVLQNGVIYLTTALLDDQEQPTSLRAIALSAEDGALRWDVEVFPVSGRAPKHPKNSFASPTPIVAGDRVFVHYGPLGTSCLDLEGQAVWRQSELSYKTPHGNGGSPALHDGSLIISADDAGAPFIVALDVQTGGIAWKTSRETEAANKFSFSTPLILQEPNRALAVSAGSGMAAAYDTATGQEIWRVRYGDGFSVVPRPVFAHGLVYVTTGFARPCEVIAVRTGGQGDVTDSHIAWRLGEGAPHTPSMIVSGEALYFLSDKGELSRVDARTGELHWRERLDGNYSASLVLAAGRLYATSEDGVTTVLEDGPAFRALARNDLGERTFASIAPSGDAIFLRTEEALYRIENR